MGNEVSSSPGPPTRNDAVHVILPDGSVRALDPPVTAAELMLDHPDRAVVEYRPAAATGVLPPVPADAELSVGSVYVMLPIPTRRGGSNNNNKNKLTVEEMRRVLSCAESVVRARSDRLLSFTGIVPVIAKAVSKKGRRRLVMFEAVAERKLGWRPSLDTIKERRVEETNNKLSHWLF